jgi:predicted ester cyclase
MSIRDTAFAFADACDKGKGWSGCSQWCHEGATFSCQADALAEIGTAEAYVDWAAGLLGPIPDATYELKSRAVDEERGKVSVFSVFKGTNTGEGPVPPTGKKIAGDYVYVLSFEDGKIKHMHKIWNDAHSLKQLGWA